MTDEKKKRETIKGKEIFILYLYICVHVRNSVDNIDDNDDNDDFGNKTVNQNQEKTPKHPSPI